MSIKTPLQRKGESATRNLVVAATSNQNSANKAWPSKLSISMTISIRPKIENKFSMLTRLSKCSEKSEMKIFI